MTAAALLDRLDGVRKHGPHSWVARCPAHEDRSPSLSIRELDDGRVLVHDFAGCTTPDVLSAVGLTLADLFPERLADHLPAHERRHYHAAREALKALRFEALLVAIAAENIAAGVVLSTEDRDDVIQASVRLRAAAELV